MRPAPARRPLLPPPVCLRREHRPAIELGADNFDIELASAKAPELIDSTVPALRAAIILQRDEGLAFKQTLIYGNGTSIQGRAWQTDTRLGYRNHLTEYLIFEPLVSLGVISITPNYQMANESNVKTKYAMAGTRLELATHFISLAADGQIGRNIDPVITNVTCTPGVSYSVGVEASAKYFGGKLVVGADRKKMPMGSGYRFEIAHIYASYRLEF